jgi:hypothetical protein
VDAEQLRAWVLVLSASAALLAIAAAVWLGVVAYCRKLRAEQRLAQASRAETEVRLVQVFVDLVLLAAGSGRYVASRELLHAMLESGVIGPEDFDTDNTLPLLTKYMRLAMVPVSSGSPTACRFAVHAVAALAARHELLRELGLAALQMERVRESVSDQVWQQLFDGLRGPPPAKRP